MTETTVVNISRGEKCDLVIDRRSRWGNLNRISPGMDRNLAIQRHMLELLMDQELIAAVHRELKGKRLGCHCAPLDCHGNNYKAVCEGWGAIRVRLKYLGLTTTIDLNVQVRPLTIVRIVGP